MMIGLMVLGYFGLRGCDRFVEGGWILGGF